MIDSSAPRRSAVRAESMATLPPPMVATRLPTGNRRVVLREAVGLHQVGARQVLVGRVDAVQVLAGNVQEPGQAGAGAQEDGVDTPARSSSTVAVLPTTKSVTSLTPRLHT